MNKSNVFLALAAALLLLACCSAAGCIVININGQDDSIIQSGNYISIVGLWIDNDDPELYYEFHKDGTMDTYYKDAYEKYKITENNPWYKYGKDTYAGYKNLYAVKFRDDEINLFSVSDDGNKLTYILSTDDKYESYNPTFTRVSN